MLRVVVSHAHGAGRSMDAPRVQNAFSVTHATLMPTSSARPISLLLSRQASGRTGSRKKVERHS